MQDNYGNGRSRPVLAKGSSVGVARRGISTLPNFLAEGVLQLVFGLKALRRRREELFCVNCLYGIIPPWTLVQERKMRSGEV
jgi:hypothetical protein